jgi:hypothetical protein
MYTILGCVIVELSNGDTMQDASTVVRFYHDGFDVTFTRAELDEFMSEPLGENVLNFRDLEQQEAAYDLVLTKYKRHMTEDLRDTLGMMSNERFATLFTVEA